MRDGIGTIEGPVRSVRVPAGDGNAARTWGAESG